MLVCLCFTLQSLHILQNRRPISCSDYGLKLSYQPAALIFALFLGSLSEEMNCTMSLCTKKYSFLLKAEILDTHFLPCFLGTISTSIAVFEPQDFSVVYFQIPQTVIWRVGTDGLFGPITSKRCLCVNVWQSYFIPASGADHIIQSSTSITDIRNFTCEWWFGNILS